MRDGCWAAALEAEVVACLAELVHERDERGRRLVVRNGHAQPRQVLTRAQLTIPAAIASRKLDRVR